MSGLHTPVGPGQQHFDVCVCVCVCVCVWCLPALLIYAASMEYNCVCVCLKARFNVLQGSEAYTEKVKSRHVISEVKGQPWCSWCWRSNCGLYESVALKVDNSTQNPQREPLKTTLRDNTQREPSERTLRENPQREPSERTLRDNTQRQHSERTLKENTQRQHSLRTLRENPQREH